MKNVIKTRLPVLQVSFIRRHLSLTEDALRPNRLPIVAQSEPCFFLKLEQEQEVNEAQEHVW